MKYLVLGKTEVEINVTVDIDPLEIKDMDDDEIQELAIEKASNELTSLRPYADRNGYDKIIGVSGKNKSIYPSPEIEWESATYKDENC